MTKILKLQNHNILSKEENERITGGWIGLLLALKNANSPSGSDNLISDCDCICAPGYAEGGGFVCILDASGE